MILQKQISSATDKSETWMRPAELFLKTKTGRTLEFSFSCVGPTLIFPAARGMQQGQITVLKDALRNIMLTHYICNGIAMPGMQAAWVALDEEAGSPDLFLFPCPVVGVATGFVYWWSHWNICGDRYFAEALAIGNLRG